MNQSDENDARCMCEAYTNRTDYGTGVEHDVDASSCPVHRVDEGGEIVRADETVGSSGRPSNGRDGACICDYNPSTTDGPDECCPFHGRPYAYWIERGDELAERLAAIEALASEWEAGGAHGTSCRHAAALRAVMASSPAPTPEEGQR